MRAAALLAAVLLSTGCGGGGLSNGGAGSGSGGTGGTAGSGGGVKPPYDPSFAINVPVPPGIGDDPRSTDIVSRLKTNLGTHKVNLSNHGEVPTVFTASPSDTLYTVSGRSQFRSPAVSYRA